MMEDLSLIERVKAYNRTRKKETKAYADIRDLVTSLSATVWNLLPKRLRELLEVYRDAE